MMILFADALEHEIQDAHKKLLANTPSQLKAGVDSMSSTSLSTENMSSAAQKKSRRAATAGEKPQTPKVTRAYGSQEIRHRHNSQDAYKFQGSSDGELERVSRTVADYKELRSKNPTKRQKPSLNTTVPTNKVGASERSIPPLSPRKHPEGQFQLSQTNTIPTIADSTPLQPPGASLTPSDPITDNDMRPFHATDSEGRMPTPTISSHSRTDGSDSFGKFETEDHLHQNTGAEQIDQRGIHKELQEPTSSAFLISPSRIIVARIPNEEAVEPYTTDDNYHDELQSPPPSFHAVGSTNPIVLPSVRQSQIAFSDKVFPASAHHNINETSIAVKGRKRERQCDDQAGELDSDDLSIGLPKEQYQPRPSRSRGSRNDEELIIPTDYSKRPEVAKRSKKKNKRCKTTAFVELIPKVEDVEDEEDEDGDQESCQILPDLKIPEFSESKSEDIKVQGKTDPAIRDHNKMIEAPDKKFNPKRQRGRPKKDLENRSIRDEGEDSVNPRETEEAPGKSWSMENPPEHRKPSKASLADTMQELDSDANEGKSTEGDVASKETPPAQAVAKAGKASNELSENTAMSKPTKGSPEVSHKTWETLPPPATPEKSSDNVAKGPDKHSPLSGGKVAYRVGLSKRARIAPLLRMVRK